MSDSITAQVASGTYEIHVGREILDRLPGYLNDLDPAPSHLGLITDGNVAEHWTEPVLDVLTSLPVEQSEYVVPPGEASKSRSELAEIWNRLLHEQADRSTVVLALGGGVVGDLAGFAAATYMRGVRLVHLPTSLLAQVDSCIGGKVGINLPDAKNAVGNFHQPSFCLLDLETLRTLPDREFREGLAEVVKYGLIMDASFLDWIDDHVQEILERDPNVLEPLVRRSVECKVEVVEQDEKEAGLRQILNFGHTLGHCIEAATAYDRFLHGEAIAPGMLAAIDLSERVGLLEEPDLYERVATLFRELGLPDEVSGLTMEDLRPHLKHDKKAKKGEPRWVLIRSAGDVEYGRIVPDEHVRAAVRRIRDTSTRT